MGDDLTRPLREAIERAEQLVANAPFIRTEQDRLEGYAYLSGRIRASIQMAFDRDLDRPVLINSTHQFARQGLDNPDALYWSAYINDHATYVVRGRRGTTADLSFQVMAGSYQPDRQPGSLAAFDDRAFDIAGDGSFEITFGPEIPDPPRNYFVSGEGAKTLIIREVFNDWDNEEPGRIWIERTDTVGRPPAALDAATMARRYEVAGQMIVGSVETWLAFPHFFYLKEPVNTLTAPASTPGGLTSQRSSIGHYALEEDEALVVTVPECTDCAYQAIQIGSDWYVSTDYESHQTSLTKAQSQVDPDGRIRWVIAERNPGVANWLETLGHQTGPIMLRWQRIERDLTADDGPVVEKVKVADLPGVLPHYAAIDDDQRAARIAARQRAVARRMLS